MAVPSPRNEPATSEPSQPTHLTCPACMALVWMSEKCLAAWPEEGTGAELVFTCLSCATTVAVPDPGPQVAGGVCRNDTDPTVD